MDSLITIDDAKALSHKLYRLGEQWADIHDDLERAGYGTPASMVMQAQEALAGTEERRLQLRSYWTEYAKERLAGLVGPMDILSGKLPQIAAYRSDLLAALRADVAAGKLISLGPIISPQIEPTVKQYVEMMPTDPLAIQVNDQVKQARRESVAKMSLVEKSGFEALSAKARYELLIERYLTLLEPAGFKLDSHRKSGLVFRKTTSNGRWAFLFVDDSRDGVDGGMLSVQFAITLPQKAVLPSALSSGAVATFSPDDIVPGFGAVRGFARSSYAQFCLAADACAFLAKTVYPRLDELLIDR
ncbi:hypothetical protein [Polaromonas sp. LjRoot131]|jgi:hypothetical protein|uniref:hypothetical protein n=1 Tax=Polaromonas sp. LjRoot131 TaxID=3342262 RepID=UPI003ECE3928